MKLYHRIRAVDETAFEVAVAPRPLTSALKDLLNQRPSPLAEKAWLIVVQETNFGLRFLDGGIYSDTFDPRRAFRFVSAEEADQFALEVLQDVDQDLSVLSEGEIE